MSLHNIPIGEKQPEIINAVIEIPKGSNNKYEFDEELGVIKLDRVLHSPMFYPVDYGFIPETRSDDGDHLDVLVITDNPTFSGCLMEVRPIAVLKMSDQGELDDKILAVAKANPRFAHIQTEKDISEHILKEISHFFEAYKTLENKKVEIIGWESKEKAMESINKAYQTYQAEQK
jgi:inorganic pyrophosphatase